KIGEADTAKAAFAESEKLADEETDASRKILLLLDVAGAFNTAELTSEAERVEGKALEAAKAIENPQARATSIAEVAAKQVSMKKTDAGKKTFEEAVTVAKEIPDAEPQAYALIGIADLMGRCGLKQSGVDTLKIAEKTEEKITAAGVRTSVKERHDSVRSALTK
ncbi:MAG TPA: hypothetical protein VGE52_16880, partial [Pirellulales bacterium]